MRITSPDSHWTIWKGTRGRAAEIASFLDRGGRFLERFMETFLRLGGTGRDVFDVTLFDRQEPYVERKGSGMMGDWEPSPGWNTNPLPGNGPQPRGPLAFRRLARFIARLMAQPAETRPRLAAPEPPAGMKPWEPQENPYQNPFNPEVLDRLRNGLANLLAAPLKAARTTDEAVEAFFLDPGPQTMDHFATLLLASLHPEAYIRSREPGAGVTDGAVGTHWVQAYLDDDLPPPAERTEIMDRSYFPLLAEAVEAPPERPWRPGLRSLLLKRVDDDAELRAAADQARNTGLRPATIRELIGFAWAYPFPAWHGEKHGIWGREDARPAGHWQFAEVDGQAIAVTRDPALQIGYGPQTEEPYEGYALFARA